MNDDRPPTSEEMLRKVRGELEAMSDEVVSGEPAAAAELAGLEVAFEEPEPPLPIRPRRVVRRPDPTPTAAASSAAPRIAVAIAVAIVLLVAGIVFAVVVATVP